MVTLSNQPFGLNPPQQEALQLANEYREVAQKLLDGDMMLNWQSVPWQDERFRRMFAVMAARQSHEAEQFRNAANFVVSLIKGKP